MIQRFSMLVMGLFILFFAENLFSQKIYDCFPFFNELEILEVRLNELYPVVDKFVLVEWTQTFQGTSKQMFFKENKERFEKFLDKIIYVELTDKIVTEDPWVREEFQRNQIARALTNCDVDDIILVSDADEIWRPEVLPQIIQGLNRARVVLCHQRMFRFFLNREDPAGWTGTYAVKYDYFKSSTSDKIRKSHCHHLPPPKEPSVSIQNAGWHFTSAGGVDRFITKLKSFAHTPKNTPGILLVTDPNIRNIIEHNLLGGTFAAVIDHTFPWYIRDNYDSFLEQGFIYMGEGSL